jgi:nucleoside 2-deoxyribosyltransferase
MSDDERASRARGPLRIGVGYGWEDGKHPLSDARWTALREFLRSAAKDARTRAAAAHRRAVVIEDEEVTDADLPSDESLVAGDVIRGVTVARLRATVGDFTWESVTQHIDDCDVLVFDVTPTKRLFETEQLTVAPNVWLELGYALHSKKPVYVVHESEKGHRDLPSDLKGLMVGLIGNDGKMPDASLRMSLVGTIRKLLLESIKSPSDTNGEVQS